MNAACFYCQAPLDRRNTRHLDGQDICAECYEDLALGGDIDPGEDGEPDLCGDPECHACYPRPIYTPGGSPFGTYETVYRDGVQGSMFTVNTEDHTVQPRMQIIYPESGDA